MNTYRFSKISQRSQVNNDFKIFGIIENSSEFLQILIGVLAIPNNFHKFQRQFPSNLELLGIPRNSQNSGNSFRKGNHTTEGKHPKYK